MSSPSHFASRALTETTPLPLQRQHMAKHVRAVPAASPVSPPAEAAAARTPLASQVADRLVQPTSRPATMIANVREELPLTRGSEPTASNAPSVEQREVILANARALASQVEGAGSLAGLMGRENANAIANWISRNRLDEQNQEGRDVANMFRSVASALSTARQALASGQLGRLTANPDGSVTTPGGYRVINDGGVQWRVVEPGGREHRIWGDPHVDENNDGRDDWHFDRDATFVLPDGTKIHCDTVKVGTHGGGDVTVSDMLRVMHGDAMATMDVKQAGHCVVGDGGRVFDRRTADGQTFVLANDHAWKEGSTLGDLYDAGGDFVADIDRSNIGTVSLAAASVLSGGDALGVSPVRREGQQTTLTGRRLNAEITTYSELRSYISNLERELQRLEERAPRFDLSRAVTDARVEQQTQSRLESVSATEPQASPSRLVRGTRS